VNRNVKLTVTGMASCSCKCAKKYYDKVVHLLVLYQNTTSKNSGKVLSSTLNM